MGKPATPLPVKLLIGILGQDPQKLQRLQRVLARHFSHIDFIGPRLAFGQTDYYEKEMGKGLKRVFISFARLIRPERLADIKRLTNHLEDKYRDARSRRTVNIDPGYISLSKLTLASTKGFAHRIYISRGIFEEVTLCYKKNTFVPSPWTYPDYRQSSHIKIFNQIRENYYRQIKEKYGLSQLYRCV